MWACASMVIVMGQMSVEHNVICEIKTLHLQRYQYAWVEVWGMPEVLRVLACSLMPFVPCARRSWVTVRLVSMLFISDKTRYRLQNYNFEPDVVHFDLQTLPISVAWDWIAIWMFTGRKGTRNESAIFVFYGNILGAHNKCVTRMRKYLNSPSFIG